MVTMAALALPSPRDASSVHHRNKRQTIGGQRLRDFCPLTTRPPKLKYKNPRVKVKFMCYGVIETICRDQQFSCMRAIPKHGYAKVVPAGQKLVYIKDTTAIQTTDCICAS